VRIKEPKKPTRLPNREFAVKDGSFRSACERAGVSPTKRQASKYRRKVGLAYREGHKS